MNVPLGKKRKVVTQQEKAVDVDAVTVQRIVYLPETQMFRVFTKELPQPIEASAAESPELATVIAAIETIVKNALK